MRAGTSRGPFFLREWLPEDPAALEQALIGAIGASDPLQLDGLGGGSSLNSKVAIVSLSTTSSHKSAWACVRSTFGPTAATCSRASCRSRSNRG
jgi:2-methylaconitate cis-trans-isomerase PrpF